MNLDSDFTVNQFFNQAQSTCSGCSLEKNINSAHRKYPKQASSEETILTFRPLTWILPISSGVVQYTGKPEKGNPPFYQGQSHANSVILTGAI